MKAIDPKEAKAGRRTRRARGRDPRLRAPSDQDMVQQPGDAVPSNELALADVGPIGDYPGDRASQAELAAWLSSEAKKAGLPPELPVMASLVESDIKNVKGGDADSAGFFQMRVGIWDKVAEYKGYRQDPNLQAKWFIDQALAVKRNAIAARRRELRQGPRLMGQLDRRRRAPGGAVPRALPAAPRRGAQAPALALADAASTAAGRHHRHRRRPDPGWAADSAAGWAGGSAGERGRARCRRRRRCPGRRRAAAATAAAVGRGAGRLGLLLLLGGFFSAGTAAPLSIVAEIFTGASSTALVPAAELALAGFGSLPPAATAALPIPKATANAAMTATARMPI